MNAFNSFYRFVASVSVLLMLWGCAPQQNFPAVDPEEPTEGASAPVPTPTRSLPVPPTPRPVPVTPTPEPLPAFDPENPDWSLRYRILHGEFLEQFETKDVVGTTMKIPLASGSTREGTITALGSDSLDLSFENGSMTLTADSLREDAQKYFFAERFAHFSAMEKARDEHAAWQARQQAPAPKPVTVATGPVNGDLPTASSGSNPDGLSHGYQPEAGAEPPRNEGPAGRVWQVDQYLRRNSAVPHSLRYKRWFPVESHGNGYKVRVQYSVESAGGLGRSNEDMMFFMYADGKVYQRAAVR